MLKSAFDEFGSTDSRRTARLREMSMPATTSTKTPTTIRMRLASLRMGQSCKFGTTLSQRWMRRQKAPRSEVDLRSQDVVQVQDAVGPMLGVDDHETRDRPALLHQVERCRRERIAVDEPRLGRHEVTRAELPEGSGAQMQPAEIAVGDDADEPAHGVDDGGHAEALVRHLRDDVFEEGIVG